MLRDIKLFFLNFFEKKDLLVFIGVVYVVLRVCFYLGYIRSIS